MAYYSELKFYYDRYDLRYDRGSGRASDCELDKVSKDIRAEYQKLEFLRKCTTHLIGVLAGVKIPRSPDHRPFPRRSDRPNERDALLREHAKLNRWEIEVAEREVGALMRILLQNHSLTKVLLPVQDFFLYRVHHKLTNSLHDPSTGIRCSAWANMLLLDEVGDPNGESFRDHMNFTSHPSPYISVHTSAARMVKLILSHGNKHTGDSSARVFVISYESLKRLGIEIWSSEYGVRRWGFRKGGGEDGRGVSYVTRSHWLVEGWIPEVAVVSEMQVGEFLDTAAKCGITRNNTMGAVWSEEVEAREIPRDMIQAKGTGGMSGLEGLFSAMSVN